MGALLTQFMNRYAYTDFHELNADWMIRTMMELINQVENFVSLNAIKYADPIQWNITKQYEKNTVIIDPLTGTAYISVQPVPMGVALTNTDYWTVVFDLGSFVVRAAKNFTNRYEADTTLTATFASNQGDWLVWGDELYEVISNIVAGDQYVVNSNIKHITMEEVCDALAQAIQNVDLKVGDLNDLTTSVTTSVVLAINSVLNDLNLTIGDLNDLTTTDKSSVVNAINEVNATGGGALALIGDLNDLETDSKDNLVNAINEIANNPQANVLSLEYISSFVSKDSRYIDFNADRYNEVIQGICINGNGQLAVVRIDAQGRDNTGTIEIYNTDGISTGETHSCTVGHGNTICYANGYYYVGWSSSVSGGVETISTNITKIPEDFSGETIISASVRTGAIGYDEVENVFYIATGGKLYKYDDDTFNTPISVVTFDESVFDTTHHANMERQNGTYYNGFWIQLYLYPAIQVWYDVETGEIKKIFNYPRRLRYNGFSVYEPESVVYNPADDYFYSTSFARCGAGDICSNTFYKFSPFKNAIDGDDRYYLRNGVTLELFVDPSINDNAFMNGKAGFPFKYIQNALDYAGTFTDTVFTIRVRYQNLYLGCIAVSNVNNVDIYAETGYTKDSSVTIPTVAFHKCSNIVIVDFNSDSITIDFSSNIQVASCDFTGEVYVNRSFTVDLKTITCDTLHPRNCGLSIRGATYNTLNKVGDVVYEQLNVAWLDAGFFTTESIVAGGHVDVPITFTRPLTNQPRVVSSIHYTADNITAVSNMHVITSAISTAGATLRVYNNDSSAHSCGVNWIAATVV